MLVLLHQRSQIGTGHFKRSRSTPLRKPRVSRGIQRRCQAQLSTPASQGDWKETELRYLIVRQLHGFDTGRGGIDQNNMAIKSLNQIMLKRNVAADPCAVNNAVRSQT